MKSIACLMPIMILMTISLAFGADEPDSTSVTENDVRCAARLSGLEFSPTEIDTMLPDLAERLESFEALHAVAPANDVPPALLFQPLPLDSDDLDDLPAGRPTWTDPGEVKRPDDLDDLRFWPLTRLAALIRTRQVTSSELTRLCLARLAEHGRRLECVVTLTEELALEQAARADSEIAAGHYRGPLHGIPYGLKDLFAVGGYRTTWGAAPYKDQIIEGTATVARKLEAAGAVLVAKLTLGALAWGDVWFDGKTRNPWNLEQGSSGSSAGSASAVAAGLVPFALGTETWGSIVSPCTRCGATGLRPTFGRVSRAGAMALSWSMDKVGPICRSVEDCAVVFDAIRGPDGLDQTVIDAPFGYRARSDLEGVKIGYLESAFAEEYPGREFDQATLEKLGELGAELVPIELPEHPVEHLSFILSAEAAAAFDELTRSGRDDLLVRQIRHAWPNVFRHARLIPAVEYLQANRIRWQIIQDMADTLQHVDVYVSPTFGSNNLLLTNLTGHPCVVVPNGFPEPNSPRSITFMGKLFDEATVLAVAGAYQQATAHHLEHPEEF